MWIRRKKNIATKNSSDSDRVSSNKTTSRQAITASKNINASALTSNFNFSTVPLLSGSTPIQAKLTIGQPNDKYEQQADQMAERVMRMPNDQTNKTKSGVGVQEKSLTEQISPLVQRASDIPQKDDDDESKMLQASAAAGPSSAAIGISNAVASGVSTMQGGGHALSPATRAFMEPRFGHDFSRVRIHADSNAAKVSQHINAKAFTVGQNVAFGAGQYQPNTANGRQLLAHELTHVVQQSGNTNIIQRAETDTEPACTSLADSSSDVDTLVNTSLGIAKSAAGTPPVGLRVASGLARLLARDVQAGRTAIEVWANTLPASKVSLPTQGATKYAGVTYRLWSNPFFPILNPTMKINEICVGSDKLGHFFQQGMTYFNTQNSSGRAAAEEESERTEGGGFGLNSTGVFSNADQEANRSGGKFYRDLVVSPTLSFGISNYISSQWSEVDNPNFYESSVGQQVWANLLTGGWNGNSSDGPVVGPPSAIDPVSLTLVATTAGAVTGSFVIRGATPRTGSITGRIFYNTTSVRASSSITGSDTTATPISGIRIEFNWRQGSQSGKGNLTSSGEQSLIGRWGLGASRDNFGALNINRS